MTSGEFVILYFANQINTISEVISISFDNQLCIDFTVSYSLVEGDVIWEIH